MIGRVAPAGLVLPDGEVSRMHCRVAIAGTSVTITDLGSTNGTFVEGQRIDGSVDLPVGAMLRVGNRRLQLERLTGRQLKQSEEQGRDIAAAAAYVTALLPPPLTEGPIRTEWCYEPSAQLGGDAFGHGFLPDGRFIVYLIDVAGHGAGAALHAVAVMNLLRQRALPETDMGDPAAVLACLNRLFPMAAHADMYFTAWYGVYDPATRQLRYAAAGHHPAWLLAGGELRAIGTRNPMIGAVADREFRADVAEMPADASLYLFSDGVFEIVDHVARRWTLSDFTALIGKHRDDPAGEAPALLRTVRAEVPSGALDDDFSLVIVRLP